jgi:hypothetical protein
MRVKVVKSKFYTDLWDAAQAAYTEKLQREANRALEAYKLAEANMAVTMSRPPTEHHVYRYWISSLGSMTEQVNRLKDNANVAAERAKKSFENKDWHHFKVEYEREHYKPPTEEDYEEVEAFSIYDPLPSEVSHASSVECVEGPVCDSCGS